jgi:quercetin dioxygenase-like cupin family protein
MSDTTLNESFGTLSESINELVKLGYTHDFNVREACIFCRNTNISLSPDEFQIDKVYRFEGATDPDAQSILYAISSLDGEIKGTLVNGYGISNDEHTSKLIERLETHEDHSTPESMTNAGTPLRPEGERILNASLVEMNLNEFMRQLKNEPSWASSDRNSMTIFKSETMRIVLISFHENAELKAHQANGVISVQVLEGRIKFSTEEKSVQLHKGQMIALQENISHAVKALEESSILLTLALNK